MKKNLSFNAVALLLISLMLVSSLTSLSSRIGYGQPPGSSMTFTSDKTINFSSTTEMTFTSPTSMKFGTGTTITFNPPTNGMIGPCATCILMAGQPPALCTWWELMFSGQPIGIEFHVDSSTPSEFHIDMVIPQPIGFPPGTFLTAELKIDSLEPCDYFVVHSGAVPTVCSWWEVTDPPELAGYEFHVDAGGSEFHVDNVLPISITLPPPGIYEATAVQKISEIKPCDWFTVTDPAGFTPGPCTWWEILDKSGLPTGQEFHVDESGSGTFHVDQVTPDPLTIPTSYTVRVRQKIDIIQQCSWFKVSDLALIPELCSWWKVTNPSGDIEFHVDASNPDGTFHVDTSTQTIPFTPPIYELTAERKIAGINACDWFTVIDPSGWVPQPCSWWKIDSPRQWAGSTFHVDSNDGVSKFHVDKVDQLPPGPTPPPYSVTAEPYTPQGPTWYTKPPYPDYAPSGMPDFDERQNNWYWRYWAYPDAVAVWQHFNEYYNDWDIYYSIYTDPNMWWTLGTDYARPIVSDSPLKMSFLPGDDKQPAISWYSSNYAIAVWQHWMGSDWDIWYSVFTPNVGWSIPAPVATNQGYNDYDPAIAFDTNGWAACVWVHGNQPAATNIYYSVWNPGLMAWVGPNTFLNAGDHGPGKAAMPEIDVDSNHKLVTIWTDTAGAPGTEKVYFSWATFNPPAVPAWQAPAIVPGCPVGMNWQKGLSPNTLGNNLMDWGLPAPSAGLEPLYYAKFNPGGVGWNPGATQINPPQTNGEHPDLAYDFNNNAIAVYTQWPTGQIWYSFWNGANWQPLTGAFAATANAQMDQWPAITFIKNNKGILVWNAYPEPYGTLKRSEIYYSVYTPTYPADSWTQAKKIYEPNNPGLFLTGDDYYVDIASPTGSATTPVSVPPATPRPAEADIYWTWCAPLAAANSIWWFDSKYEPNAVTPPTISDGFPLVKSYNSSVWDDHDPRNVKPFVEHLAYLMDTDGMRTKLCHDGTTVWDMQAGITQYLSWSGVNPLGDVDGNGIVDMKDVGIVTLAMGSKPGDANWNMSADIWPETVTGPRTADNVIDQNDLDLVIQNFGKKGMFYEHTTGLYPSFSYIEEEVERCQDVVLCLGFYDQYGYRDGGHFVTVAGVNSTTYQLLISNPIRDDYEAGVTPGRSPVAHPYPHDSTIHNNASLVSQDAYTIVYNAGGGYWALLGYFTDPTWEARIEFAVITSPTGWVHDVAVKNVKSSRSVVGQGLKCPINVTVINEGDFPETFDLTVYAQTMLTPPEIINTTTVTDLLVGETRSIILTWNTSGFAKGNYTLSAYAWPVMGEIDTADNRKVDGWVVVTIPGDATGDGVVEAKDLRALMQAWPPAPYNPNCDFNADGVIEGKDLRVLGLNWGKTDP